MEGLGRTEGQMWSRGLQGKGGESQGCGRPCKCPLRPFCPFKPRRLSSLLKELSFGQVHSHQNVWPAKSHHHSTLG